MSLIHVTSENFEKALQHLEAQKDVHQMLGSLCVYLIKVLCMQALRCAGCR